ncbi:MAG: hypothetical protein IT269_10455 [Saprospiraceae bacterium]|nr:hypothetical protein [Saprospiraceae bacterium]
MDGLFFADGEVKGYNFKNELAENCLCADQRLSCQRLKSTIEEQKFAEIIGTATIAVAEIGLLLKAADKISGPSAPGGGRSAISEPAKTDPAKAPDKKRPNPCFDAETATKESVKVCDNTYAVTRVSCQDGETRDYFYIDKDVSCGLVGGLNKGYYRPSYYLGANIGQTFLAVDYEAAMKKLCKCK